MLNPTYSPCTLYKDTIEVHVMCEPVELVEQPNSIALCQVKETGDEVRAAIELN